MKRPTFLTVWLILMLIANLITLFSYTLGASNMMAMMPGTPAWAFPTLSALVVSQIICVVLLWLWKKIGFYLIVAEAIVVAVLNVIILGSAGLLGGTGIISILFGLAGVGILYLAMRPVWEQFK